MCSAVQQPQRQQQEVITFSWCKLNAWCVRYVMLQMPDELLYDPQVIELREEIKGLQGEFVNSHKALDAAQQHVK